MAAHGGTRSGAGRKKGQGNYGEATKAIRLPVSLINQVVEFVQHKGYQLPLYGSKVPAGFPSPADDFLEGALDLNAYLIKHPSATFLVRASGQSMINAGIHENDLLVVDRSLTPTPGKIVIAAIDGELTVKRLQQSPTGHLLLVPENPLYPSIEIRDNNDVHIWGVVTFVLHAAST